MPQTFQGSRQAVRELKLLQAKRSGVFKWSSSQWKGAKGQLRREARGKCVYCDAPADSVAHCDVEHYRPKSRYWWLSLCYDNYLFSCQLCNEVYKGDAFPHHGPTLIEPAVTTGMTDAHLGALVGSFAPDPTDVAAVTRHAALWAAEDPDFVHPYFEDPAPLFAYDANDALREVRVVPNGTAVQRRRASATIDGYGLNREELRLQRHKTYEILALAHEAYAHDLSNTRLLRLIALFVRDDAAFAGMNRYFVRHVWRLPV